MKKLFLCFCILVSYGFANAQPTETSNGLLASLNAFGSGATFSDGFNVGVSLTAEMNWFYVAPELFYFPDLKGYTYFHYGASLGVNGNRIIHKEPTALRPYLGFGGGIIRRFSHPHPTFWVESGLSYYIPGSDFVIGLRSTYQYRTEYINKPFWLYNTFLSIGIKL